VQQDTANNRLSLGQASPNFFIRGLYKLLHNSPMTGYFK